MTQQTVAVNRLAIAAVLTVLFCCWPVRGSGDLFLPVSGGAHAFKTEADANTRALKLFFSIFFPP